MSSVFIKNPGILTATHLKTLKNNCGAVLIAVVITSIILTLGAAGLIIVATSASKNETLSLNDNSAFLAAESGLIMGARWINDGTNYTTAFGSASDGYVLQNVIPGLSVNTFNVQVNMEKTATGVLIKSTAQSSGKINYDKQLIQHANSAKYLFDTTAFDYYMICDGLFGLSGNFDIAAISGIASIHSNCSFTYTGSSSTNEYINISSCDTITVTAGNKTINANLAASLVTIGNNATVTGTITTGPVDYVTIPDIDLLPFFYEALYNGQVIDGDFTCDGDPSCANPPGGIVWVNGKVTISGGKGTTFYGTVIATGNINVNEKIILDPPNHFALASINGDIHLSSSGAINGLIYAKNGSYSQQSNGLVNGQIIVGGTINCNGTSAVTFTKYIPDNPNTGKATGCKLASGSWVEKNI